MTRSTREIEREADVLKGRLWSLVEVFQRENGVVVTEVQMSRVTLRTVGAVSHRAIPTFELSYVPEPEAS